MTLGKPTHFLARFWTPADANLTIKEEILAKTAPIKTKVGRYKPDDDLLAFLKTL